MPQISILTSLRGFAILGVIFHHYYYRYFDSSQNHYLFLNQYDVFPFAPFASGWTAVNLFFILSGIVLFLPYVKKESPRQLNSYSDLINYTKNRFLRLFPLYWLSLVICWIFIKPLTFDLIGLKEFLILSTATQTFTQDLWFPKINMVLWSISVEIWFSIVFPFIVLLNKKVSIFKIYLLAIPLCLAIRIYSNNHTQFDLGTPYLGSLKDSLLGRLDDFLLGMCIAQLWINRNGKSLSPLKFWTLFLGGLTLIFVGFQFWNIITTNLLGRWPSPYINLLFATGWFMVIWALLNTSQDTLSQKLSQFLTIKPFVFIGTLCYSLYIWHSVIREHFIGRSQNFFLHIAVLCATLLISWATYRYIEVYFQKFGQKK